MSIIGIVVVLLIFGFIIFLIQTAPIPISPWIKSLIIGILCIGVIIYLLQAFGIDAGFGHLKVK